MDVPHLLYRSLDRLVLFTLSCGVISAAGFTILSSLHRPASKSAFWTAFVGVAVLSLGGMLLMSLATSRLRDALQNERWSHMEVEVWRSRTRSGWWRAAVGVALVLMFAAMVFGDRHHRLVHGFLFSYWPFFVIIQTLSQISTAFHRTAGFGDSGSDPMWRNWRNFGKLQSDHWGER